MKDWLTKNRDAIVITAVGITATVVVAGVTHKITKDYANALTNLGNYQMSMIASEAGVLDKLIEHQNKLTSITK